MRRAKTSSERSTTTTNSTVFGLRQWSLDERIAIASLDEKKRERVLFSLPIAGLCPSDAGRLRRCPGLAFSQPGQSRSRPFRLVRSESIYVCAEQKTNVSGEVRLLVHMPTKDLAAAGGGVTVITCLEKLNNGTDLRTLSTGIELCLVTSLQRIRWFVTACMPMCSEIRQRFSYNPIDQVSTSCDVAE